MATAITHVRLFDGDTVHDNKTVLIENQTIVGIDIPIPSDTQIVDGTGKTLLPGLIDAHTHTKEEFLKLALQFGITTELEMMGSWRSEQREAIKEDDTLADLKTADFGMTAPGGHPAEILARIPAHARPGGGGGPPNGAQGGAAHAHAHAHAPSPRGAPTVSSVDEAAPFVEARVKAGADYIKFMLEEGSVLGSPGLPLLSNETIVKGVEAAHAHGKLTVAHALTQETTIQALNAGMDGLAHLFIDSLITPDTVRLFKEKKAFITPCACLNASSMGIKPAAMLEDTRVTSRLNKPWLETLQGTFDCYSAGDFKNILGSIKALHEAGIDILAGTDVSHPFPELGGLAHGASVHHEMQLFVEAGMKPVEALKAATSVTARCFRMEDRGRIAPGLRADLLLVEGDPTRDIKDTLNIHAVWRRGARVSL